MKENRKEDWTSVFNVPENESEPTASNGKGGSGACNPACQRAKAPKCVCVCGGAGHGILVKKNDRRLEAYQEVGA